MVGMQPNEGEDKTLLLVAICLISMGNSTGGVAPGAWGPDDLPSLGS